ncbi:hypothetical protein HH303_11330 [Rhodospirillaceae bacterium KN72]|uniref:Uncharacterized protein n=1 Tax=Pacificispira spongiicola TaxID=2729598 RepID=A0A7Y0E0M6_9PROT|nr:DUF6765 family protein [Pacificispira spongiicola]NMM45073.1 hypothetical protein [Pacificispira spongiicola]
MQIDMHYYGTYALARAAGLNAETAKIIATAAQFVDDNAANVGLTLDANSGNVFEDGAARIATVATAHHVLDKANLEEDDQRQVWIPFHFLPGNMGESYTERLKCRMDSAIAREMVDHHLGLADRDFSPALIGVTAHVYADTFSHYGFSGVSSRGNAVDNSSFQFHEDIDGHSDSVNYDPLDQSVRDYIQEKMRKHFEKGSSWSGISIKNIRNAVTSYGAEIASGALGHGSVSTFPDRPYLVWAFRYERPDAVAGNISYRNNPATFMAAARALHQMFDRFRLLRRDFDDGTRRDFEVIHGIIKKAILFQGECGKRIVAWQVAAEELGIGEIPPYQDDSSDEGWNNQWARLGDGKHFLSDAGQSPIWKFYQAASIHRLYVLRDLLPRHGLIVH